MESKATFKAAPETTFEPEDKSLEVRRLDVATNDLVGPVVVGGRASADCFRFYDSVQAGVTDPDAYGSPLRDNDGDADDKDVPSRPW